MDSLSLCMLPKIKKNLTTLHQYTASKSEQWARILHIVLTNIILDTCQVIRLHIVGLIFFE